MNPNLLTKDPDGEHARARHDQGRHTTIILTISLQAVVIVALICVTVFLAGKIESVRASALEAKAAAQSAQMVAEGSAAHIRYVSCEVQRNRPRTPTSLFTQPFQCTPPPRDPPPAAPAQPTSPGEAARAPATKVE